MTIRREAPQHDLLVMHQQARKEGPSNDIHRHQFAEAAYQRTCELALESGLTAEQSERVARRVKRHARLNPEEIHNIHGLIHISVRNAKRDSERKKALTLQCEVSLESLPIEPPAPVNIADEVIARQFLLQAVEPVLEELRRRNQAQHADILERYIYEGDTTAEIAVQLGISTAAVRQRRCRAAAAARRIMEPIVRKA